MSDRRPDWDDQFAETENERNERLRAKRQRRGASSKSLPALVMETPAETVLARGCVASKPKAI